MKNCNYKGLGDWLNDIQITCELSIVEEELKSSGFSEAEIARFNQQVDGIIEQIFDSYFERF